MDQPPSGSRPTEIRHVIENSLAAYTKAMDDQDAETAARLLAMAELHFKGNPPLQGAENIGAFYASAFPNPSRTRTRTRHIITNLTTAFDGNGTNYTAIYQRWSVADPTAPVCEAIGHYAGRFTVTTSGPTWAEHRVITT